MLIWPTVRAWSLLLVLGGCDKLLLTELPAPTDVMADAMADATPADAAPNHEGCSDRSREGFLDSARYPLIAACAGAWDIAGLRDPVVSCGRMAGDGGQRSSGVGCSAADLCIAEWHVCQNAREVRERLPPDSQTCAGLESTSPMFFATAQSGPGSNMCDPNGTNDFFGCGTYGQAVPEANCPPLTLNSGDGCGAIKPGGGGWVCPNTLTEVTTVTKTTPLVGGGVLCCRDQLAL